METSSKKFWAFISKPLSFILSTIITAIITALFCINANVFLGNIGCLNTQIELADKARIDNEYSESINWYAKIAKNDPNYAPYAHLAMAEIYSLELANKNYNKALDEYKYAVSISDNTEILNSAMHFIVQQISYGNDNEDFAIDLLNDDNISFVVDVLNKLNQVDSHRFAELPIDFPVDEADVIYIFRIEPTFTIDSYRWEYVSTITSDKSGLGYVNDTEKVMLVNVETLPVSKVSLETVNVYTYYRYEKVIDGSYEISSLNAIWNVLDPQSPIQLNSLHFE